MMIERHCDYSSDLIMQLDHTADINLKRQNRTSRNLRNNTYNFYLVIEVPDHVCLLCVTVIFCRQGHIHDPVLLSKDRNYTCYRLNGYLLFCPPPFRIPRPHRLISSACQGYSFEKVPLPKHHVACYIVHLSVSEAMTSRCCGCNFSFSIHSA